MNKNNKTQRKYVQHFSTRIPWKDNDYTGRIDDNPKYNVAAQVIPNINASRNLEFEENNKGKCYKDVDSNELKNWITENAAFMSDSILSIKMHHPYSNRNNALFSHFKETIFKVEPYSFLLRPFSWTLIEKTNETDQRLKYIRYDDTEEFEKLFFEAIAETVKMESTEDIEGFNKSLGATKNGKYTNYNTGNNVEDWQVLSPTKFVGTGSYYLNNQIHLKYRQDVVEKWNQYTWSKNKPLSDQNIVYGDKVISIVNEERNCWDRIEQVEEEKVYIANGEIGIMTNYPKQYGRDDKNDEFYKFMFGSFDGKVFSYTKSDFGGENSESKLELAYALTVHKSQGSGFGNTIVVINGKSSFLSKELLYTAFSRQREKLLILSDLSLKELAQ